MSMNKPARPAFQAVEIDGIDERLEAQAVEKGIPTLMVTKTELLAATPSTEPPVTARAPAAPRGRAGGQSQTTPRARMKTLNVEVPDYAWIEIKMRAARQMTSVRHVIMTALKVDGIEISEADMIEDGRRLRGSEAN